jgi:hypothetical protein
MVMPLSESISSLAQSRGFNQEQFELQLSLVEILLDVADRRGTEGALRRARSAFEEAQRRFVPALSAQEQDFYAERLAQLSERLSSTVTLPNARHVEEVADRQIESATDDLPEVFLQGREDFREGDRLRQDLGK